MREPPVRARSGNLTAALVAFAALELAINRLALRLFLPQSTVAGPIGEGAGGGRGLHLVAASGPLLFHLTGVLGLVVLVAGVAGLLKRGELFPRGMRLVVAIITVFFAALVALGLVAGAIPAALFMNARIGAAFSSLFVVGALAVSGVRPRVKVGVALCALPALLHVAALFVDRVGAGSSDVAGALARARDLVGLAACLGAPFLLPPRPAAERPWRLPLAITAATTATFALLLLSRYDLVQAAFLYGLRVELAPGTLAVCLAAVAAFAGGAYAATQLLVDKGGMRLAGYGLVLLAVAGPQAGTPVELTLAVVGLLALAVGELRAAPYGEPARVPRAGSEAWRAYIGRLATAAGDGTSPDDSRSEGVVVEEGELEVTRIRAHRRGLPVAMRLLRRRGALVELEATVGEPARGGPDASIERHRHWLARGPHERVRLPRAKTGDTAFDQRFSVHGAAPLGDAALRRQLLAQTGDGVVTLWRGAAARYHATSGQSEGQAEPAPFSGEIEGDAPVLNIVAVLDTLADLVEAG
ncbi:MAG TPA: hypothetical protein VHJ20_02790 [Polyangia bacterium]|nr:hypothetical protein [Polyangia bacterium]